MKRGKSRIARLLNANNDFRPGAVAAPLTWYLTNNSVGPGSDLSLTDPGAEAFRTPTTGWIVGTATDETNSAYFNDVERAAATFSGVGDPDGSLDTVNGDFWVSPAPLTGSFAPGNWTITMSLRNQTAGGANTVAAICRLFRGVNQDGSGATEITAAQQTGTETGALAAGNTVTSTITFNPGAFSVTGEYVFIQLAVKSKTQNAGATADGNLRIGNGSGTGSRVVTSNFS